VERVPGRLGPVPELPEVETVRRNLEATILGRTIVGVSLSGKKLRAPIARGLPSRARGRSVDAVRRHGKYLLVDLAGGVSLISHLGMSGRWLFHAEAPVRRMAHVHVRVRFSDDTELWFQDPRRFGLLKLVATDRLSRDPTLAILGPDPIASPPSGAWLSQQGRGASIAVKNFLLDQKRIAGIGNIYASEILHRAGVDPRRRASSLARAEWDRVAPEIGQVLGEAIARMGTTFSMYRTLWNEPGTYGDQLMVYDRAGEPCRRCGTAIRRIVQGQRSTFYCPSCQGRKRPASRGAGAARVARPPASSRSRAARSSRVRG
jgi:formamidopyrimidine-DNA glycosylase